MGKRRIIECIEIPIAVFLFPSDFEINDILAGSEIAFHAEKNNIPINTATQLVKITAIKYPAIAIMSKTRKAFLFPIQSATYPPGKDQNAPRKFNKNPKPLIISTEPPNPFQVFRYKPFPCFFACINKNN